MVVDGHCHAGRGDGLTAPWNTAAPLDSYLRRAASAGITKTVSVMLLVTTPALLLAIKEYVP